MTKNDAVALTLFIIAIGVVAIGVFYSLTNPANDQVAQTDNQVLAVGDIATDPNLSGQPQDKNDQITDNQSMNTKQLPKPEMKIDVDSLYYAILDTTEGKIKIELNAKSTQITTNNFVYLAENKFYNETIFHRTINGFMIQGGDPTGTGAGGPGYKFDDEPFSGEYTRGVVAMANSGKNTNGSQFFVMHGDTPLQKDYVIFGKVIEGMDVVDKIATAPVIANEMGEQSKPVNPVKINSVEIITEKASTKVDTEEETKTDETTKTDTTDDTETPIDKTE